MSRQTLRRGHRKICIGDLKDRVQIQLRQIDPPPWGSTDFDLVFSSDKEAFAMIRTTQGKVFFDGVNTDIPLTHEIIIRYDEEITAESWLQLMDGRLLDIINVEDLEERHEYLRLRCRERGPNEIEAAQA
jgi:SPP1 family predicted phage head-tail adaptor